MFSRNTLYLYKYTVPVCVRWSSNVYCNERSYTCVRDRNNTCSARNTRLPERATRDAAASDGFVASHGGSRAATADTRNPVALCGARTDTVCTTSRHETHASARVRDRINQTVFFYYYYHFFFILSAHS